MAKVKTRKPELKCLLKFDKLYIDNRVFVVDDEGQVVEQPVVTLPALPDNIHPGFHITSKGYGIL